MLPEQIGECFIRQLLDRRHPVASKLLQLVEGVVVEVDQLAHALSVPVAAALGGSSAAGENGSREPYHRTEPAAAVVVE